MTSKRNHFIDRHKQRHDYPDRVVDNGVLNQFVQGKPKTLKPINPDCNIVHLNACDGSAKSEQVMPIFGLGYCRLGSRMETSKISQKNICIY
jgi:hypothetical protein